MVRRLSVSVRRSFLPLMFWFSGAADGQQRQEDHQRRVEPLHLYSIASSLWAHSLSSAPQPACRCFICGVNWLAGCLLCDILPLLDTDSSGSIAMWNGARVRGSLRVPGGGGQSVKQMGWGERLGAPPIAMCRWHHTAKLYRCRASLMHGNSMHSNCSV